MGAKLLAVLAYWVTLAADAVTLPAPTPVVVETPAAAPTPAPGPFVGTLTDDQNAELKQWFQDVQGVRPGESFGALIVRIGKRQLGKPYSNPQAVNAPEALSCDLHSFQCVSFVESSLALARCLWRKQTDSGCFLQELQGLRYRNGQISGFASKLHYYNDWLDDNAKRGTLVLLGAELGGQHDIEVSNYMTRHPQYYPPMADPEVFRAVADMETRVNTIHLSLISRSRVADIESQLQDGDIIAIGSTKPGMIISHTGFVMRTTDGATRMLHASSLRHKVVQTTTDLARYLAQRPERHGIYVARPVAPETVAQTPEDRYSYK